MNKLGSVIISVIFGFNVQAAQLPLFPELDELDAQAELSVFCQTEGLECYIESYDVQSFDAGAKLNEISAELFDEEGAWQYEVDANVKYVITHSYMDRSGGYDALKYYYKNRRIKAAFGFYPNPDQCTESEYCSLYRVYVFLDNGQMISIFFDFNT